ncbi:MAG: hypothetical protein GY720_14485 [bacterium]|nr:hypothetical protein [bacterium]
MPVIVSLSQGGPVIDVERADGGQVRTEGLVLDRQTSQTIFERRGEIVAVRVAVPRGRINRG